MSNTGAFASDDPAGLSGELTVLAIDFILRIIMSGLTSSRQIATHDIDNCGAVIRPRPTNIWLCFWIIQIPEVC